MAVRERQLGALGMRSNERGQVTAQCSLTQQVADLAEENGAVCCICREGYKYQPTKVCNTSDNERDQVTALDSLTQQVAYLNNPSKIKWQKMYEIHN